MQVGRFGARAYRLYERVLGVVLMRQRALEWNAALGGMPPAAPYRGETHTRIDWAVRLSLLWFELEVCWRGTPEPVPASERQPPSCDAAACQVNGVETATPAPDDLARMLAEIKCERDHDAAHIRTLRERLRWAVAAFEEIDAHTMPEPNDWPAALASAVEVREIARRGLASIRETGAEHAGRGGGSRDGEGDKGHQN